MNWDQVIRHSEAMQKIITTVKRSDDWMAYVTGSKGQWASDRTESEAIGELYRVWFEAIVEKIKTAE